MKASFMLPHSKRVTAEFSSSAPVTHLVDFISKQVRNGSITTVYVCATIIYILDYVCTCMYVCVI